MPRNRSRHRSKDRLKDGSRGRIRHRSRSPSRVSSRYSRLRSRSQSFSRSRTPRRDYRDKEFSRTRSRSQSRSSVKRHYHKTHYRRSRSRKTRSRRSRGDRRSLEDNCHLCCSYNLQNTCNTRHRDCNHKNKESLITTLPALTTTTPRNFSSNKSIAQKLPSHDGVQTPPVPSNLAVSTSQGREVCNQTDESIQNSETSTLAHALIEAIKTIQPTKCPNYFVSNFDPSIQNINIWCEEVERAKDANHWTDHECLSRVASCLKGDAKVWLNEWVTNDRTWSNFKREFTPLCPGKLDFANILFEAMKNTSDNYTTYAEYARRTLLRLRVVSGLSEELRTLIVIRGIDNPQIRAAAANAELTSDKLVSFLSIYSKSSKNNAKRPQAVPQKRFYQSKSSASVDKSCFECGQKGHIRYNCPKKPKTSLDPELPTKSTAKITCSFCKKPGHNEHNCFSKLRSEPRNQRHINLCSELSKYPRGSRDVTAAVVEGIPMDVLIDSGAMNISLISSDVLKYLPCQPKIKHCTLKGISDKEIECTSYVTVTLEFDNISIEANLVVVPSSYMNTPIIIGTDVLNRDGVTYVRTKDRQYLTHSKVIPAKINSAEFNEEVYVNTPLQNKERESLMAVIHEYSEFLITGTATTTVKTGKMEIKLTSSTPVVYRPYKLSYQEKLKVRDITMDLLDKGIIRRSQSEYASPIILVKKRDGSDRLCVDFRALNRITVKDRYPLPLINDHIDRLGGFKFFSSLDMATGFHQIPIKEECIHLTGFVTPEDHFEYIKMPYGLANSPIVYQRIINDTLRSHINDGNVLVYVDDVLLLSNSISEGIDLLRRVLNTLTNAGFSINLRKCTFLTTEVEYLGRVVRGGQVKPSPRKVEALANTSPPVNVKQVRQFLGLAGYFRRYIKDYATKTECIARLTRKNVPFHWGDEQEKVRQDLIGHLTSKPILAIFDHKLPTEVHTDAAAIGYGAVLLQTHLDGKKHVVAYFSKATQGAESRYHSYELETLAVVKALQHFRHYLIGIRFVLITDCNALKSTERKKDLIPRVARWWIYLQDFDFTIEYRKGIMIPHADYLSRNAVNQVTRPRNWAQIAQAADDETQKLLEKLQEGSLDSVRYVKKNDLLYYRYSPVGEEPRLLCYIPKGHRLSLLRVFHDEHEHIGVDKTIDLILKHFWFPGLRQFVSKYVAHCLICISKKRVPRAPQQYITSWAKPDAPFNTVHIDALGPLPISKGFKFVLIMIDAFTKYCLLYPIHRQDAIELKHAVTQAISLFGVPALMVCDKGRMFESKEFTSWIIELGCNLHYITPEMHHANGQVERYVRTVLNMIRVEVNHKGAIWSEVLWKLQLVLNITKQKTTHVSPLNLLIGTEATTPVIRGLVRDIASENLRPNREALREITRSRTSQLLKENQTRQDEYANRHRHPARQFAINDLVFVIKFSQSTGKLDPGMRGPYKVVSILPGGRYELKLLSGSYGKTTQAAAQYMVPWRGEWCPETCAAFFDNDETGYGGESSPTLAAQGPDVGLPTTESSLSAVGTENPVSSPRLSPEPGSPATGIAGPSGTTPCSRFEDDPSSG